MTKNNVVVWFRQDLRLEDNPALYEAAQRGCVIPIYILDEVNAGNYKMGAASRCWLHYSLHELNKSLKEKLIILQGDAKEILPKFLRENNSTHLFVNRCYEPWRIARDKEIKSVLEQHNIQYHSYNASLLWEPWDVLKADGTPYKVFTPFYRKGCLSAQAPGSPLPAPQNLSLSNIKTQHMHIDDLHLLPNKEWYTSLIKYWHIGEKGARQQLRIFLTDGIKNYKKGRDFPGKDNVSRLSPHLHFGEISPRHIWHAVSMQGDDRNIDHFCSELGWREFSYSLLYHFPHLPEENLNPLFDQFAWQDNHEALLLWQKGQTGIPIVDAGMRELWQTGYMHNRVRMIVASFLIKNLLIHWKHGERWFWECLFDADLANNSASWQWVAGSGADAAPYFRIFNPVIQGYKFDPDGEYTRRFVPELHKLPDKYLFNPWEAPRDILEKAEIKLGKDYPEPIIDIRASRERALKLFDSLKTEKINIA